jgi:putative addiction module component (TIGR02574 family)
LQSETTDLQAPYNAKTVSPRSFFMGTSDLQAIFALSPAERIELAEDLWDSVALEAAGQPLKAHEIAEIEKRLTEHRARPQDLVSWNTVKANLNLA